jgi:HAD superfamily hydrolase (TIGR01549 family)
MSAPAGVPDPLRAVAGVPERLSAVGVFVDVHVYEAVVFDNDGVLTERTDRGVLRDAARAAFEAYDVDPDEETVDSMVAGVDPGVLGDVCTRYDLDPEAFWRERDRQFVRVQCRETDAGRKPMYSDVDVLGDLDVPMGVVSNNQNATIDHVFAVHDLHRYFDTWYGREPTVESVERKKPEPYYVEQALEDLDATGALFVGDKRTDVQAAHAAGIDAALVRRPHNDGVDVTDIASGPHGERSTYVIDSLADLTDHLERY